jgi:hypothetical protein
MMADTRGPACTILCIQLLLVLLLLLLWFGRL